MSWDIRKARGFEIIDFDGPVFNTYIYPNAPKAFDNGDFTPFENTNHLVSAEAIMHINNAVRNGIVPVFNTAALGTSFRGKPLPFTQNWGPEGSDQYLQNLREFQRRGYEAKLKQFESLRSMLAPDVRAKISAENNLIVTQPSAGENKIDTTFGFFNRHNVPVNDILKARTAVYDDEQGNLDKFAAAGFTNTKLTLPSGFTPTPFAKDAPYKPWFQNWNSRPLYGTAASSPRIVPTATLGSGDPTPHTNPIYPQASTPSNRNASQWGSHPTVLVSPSSIQGLDYAKKQKTPLALERYKAQIQGANVIPVEDRETEATQFGTLAESRFNEGLLRTNNVDDFYKFVAGEDFHINAGGVSRDITPEWSKQQIEAVLPFISEAQQQRVLGNTMDIQGQSIRLSGMPDYYKKFEPSERFPNGAIFITDMKTSGMYGNAKDNRGLRDTYKTQAAAYSWLASLENPGVPVYMGYMHAPVKGDKASSLSWVPNRTDSNGVPLPEDIDANKAYLESRVGTWFNDLDKMGLRDTYAERMAGQRLKVGPVVRGNEIISSRDLTGGNAVLPVSDYTATEDNPNPGMSAGTVDDLIAKDKQVGVRGLPSPIEETVAGTLEALSQNMMTLIDLSTRSAQAKGISRISDKQLATWEATDKSDYKGDRSYTISQIAKRVGLQPYRPDGKLHPIIADRLDEYDTMLEQKAEAAQVRETERLERKAEAERDRTKNWAQREKYYRKGRIAAAVSDLDLRRLSPAQQAELTDKYNDISIQPDVLNPEQDSLDFAAALREVTKEMKQAEHITDLWAKTLGSVTSAIQNAPFYNGERLAQTFQGGAGRLNQSASGIIPRRLKGAAGHLTGLLQDEAGLWWDENWNIKYKAAEAFRKPAIGILSGIAGIAGTVLSGGNIMVGGAAAGIAGSLANIPAVYSQYKGNIAERDMKVWFGHASAALNLMSIFGELAKNLLAVPIKMFTGAVKTTAASLTAAAVLMNRFMKQGLDNLSGLASPIRSLSGISGYRRYQGLGFADTFLGHSKGTTSRAMESFGEAQANLYARGQLDENRVIAASLLGQFDLAYGNSADPDGDYVKMTNNLARQMNAADARERKRILALAKDISPELPQTLQVMYEMGVTDFNEITRPSGVYWRGIGDAERGAMRRTNVQWQATQEMFGLTKSRIASTIWNRVGRNLYNGMSQAGDLISQGHWKDWTDSEGNEHKGAINTALGTFKAFIQGVKEWWDSSELSSAIVEFVQNAVKNVKEWIANLDIGGLASIISGKISGLFASLDWNAIMEGPLGEIFNVLKGVGQMLMDTFLNVFRVLSSMRFDAKAFALGKQAFSFGATIDDSYNNEPLKDPSVRAVEGNDYSTQYVRMLKGGRSRSDQIAFLASIPETERDKPFLMIDEKPYTLDDAAMIAMRSTKNDIYAKSAVDAWTGIETWMITSGRSSIFGSNETNKHDYRLVKQGASNFIEALGAVGTTKAGGPIMDAIKDGVSKLKIYIVGKDGVEREALVRESSTASGDREYAIQLLSAELVR